MISKLFDKFLNDDFRLVSNSTPFSLKLDVKYSSKYDFKFNDIKDEFLDSINSNENIFSVYMNVFRSVDESKFKKINYRFDLFVLNSKMVGREHSKTCSLDFVENDESKPSVFHILNGEGFILLEDLEDEKNLKIVKIEKGSYVYVPKGFVFILINKSEKDNLIALSLTLKSAILKSKLLKSKCGATLYYTRLGFRKNNNSEPFYNIDEHYGDYVNNFSFDKQKGLYVDFIELAEKFNFLKE